MNYRSIEIYFNGILKIPVDREVKYYVNVGSRWLYTGGGESADMLLTLVSTSLFAFLKKKSLQTLSSIPVSSYLAKPFTVRLALKSAFVVCSSV